MTYDKIIFSPVQPNRTDVAWAKPVKGGFSLYLYFNGRWQPQRVANDEGTYTTDDDVPYDINEGGGGKPGPNTVGTEQIIDNSIMEVDLNDTVKEKLDDVYVDNDESLYINGTRPSNI
jgi:hypothetical protein